MTRWRLEESVGSDITEELKQKYRIYFQRDASFGTGDNVIVVCADMFRSTQHERSILDGEPVVVEVETRRLNEYEEQNYFDNVVPLIKYVNQYGQTIAVTDMRGVLHTCNFHDDGRAFKEFKKIVDLHEELYRPVLISTLVDRIGKLPGVKLRTVELTFDEDFYKAELQNKIETFLDTIKSIESMKTAAIIEERDAAIAALNREKDEALMEGFLMGIKMHNVKYWKITDRGTLRYRKTIKATKVKKNGEVFKLCDDIIGKFYIKGLEVAIRPYVYNSDVIFRSAYHPNFSGVHSCIGDLEGKPFVEVIQTLPEMVETMNLDSAWDCRATKELEDYLEVYTSGEATEVWDADAWSG